MNNIPPRLKAVLVMPVVMVRYAFSPAFRRLVRMQAARQKRTEDFVVQKVRELAERGDPKYREMLGMPPVRNPNRPRPARNMTEMYERARWKCERCGKMNEWGQPTCPCNHKR